VGLDPAVLDPAASAREVISVVEMDLISKIIQAGICSQEERYLRRMAVFVSGKSQTVQNSRVCFYWFLPIINLITLLSWVTEDITCMK
jgi:hypothetical protein